MKQLFKQLETAFDDLDSTELSLMITSKGDRKLARDYVLRVKSFFKSSQKQTLDKVVEKLNGMKKEIDITNETAKHNTGYNFALNDLKEKLNE